MSFDFYKLFHIFAILAMMGALGGIATHTAQGGTKANLKARGLLSGLHGIGLLLLLVSGFGMLARLGYEGVPWWVWAKLVVWLAFGGALAVAYRMPHLSRALLVILPLLGVVATYLATYTH